MSTQPIPVWLSSLKHAIQEGFKTESGTANFQFATVRPNGKPAVRTVVFRGFISENYEENGRDHELNPNTLLTFTTHFDSFKVDELKKNNQFELCWWFPSSREQYRISGNAHLIVSPDKVGEFPYPRHLSHALTSRPIDWEFQRNHFFKKMSPPLKTSFTWPAPGKVLSNGDFSFELKDTEIDLAKYKFVLVVLEPLRVDLVHLDPQHHQRILYTLVNHTSTKEKGSSDDPRWEFQQLNP